MTLPHYWWYGKQGLFVVVRRDYLLFPPLTRPSKYIYLHNTDLCNRAQQTLKQYAKSIKSKIHLFNAQCQCRHHIRVAAQCFSMVEMSCSLSVLEWNFTLTLDVETSFQGSGKSDTVDMSRRKKIRKGINTLCNSSDPKRKIENCFLILVTEWLRGMNYIVTQ